MQQHISILLCCIYLLIINTPNNNNSNCHAATVMALEMGVLMLYFETGGMKGNATAAVKLEAYFSVLLHTSQTSRSGWLDRLGTTMGPCVCSFNV